MILLDTHVAVWMSTEKRKISPAAGLAIRAASRAGESISIASSTLWEVAMLSTTGKIRLPTQLGEYLQYMEKVFEVLPITGAIAERSVLMNRMAGDPTDRIIVATAIVHEAALITVDKKIRASGQVNCIW